MILFVGIIMIIIKVFADLIVQAGIISSIPFVTELWYWYPLAVGIIVYGVTKQWIWAILVGMALVVIMAVGGLIV